MVVCGSGSEQSGDAADSERGRKIGSTTAMWAVIAIEEERYSATHQPPALISVLLYQHSSFDFGCTLSTASPSYHPTSYHPTPSEIGNKYCMLFIVYNAVHVQGLECGHKFSELSLSVSQSANNGAQRVSGISCPNLLCLIVLNCFL